MRFWTWKLLFAAGPFLAFALEWMLMKGSRLYGRRFLAVSAAIGTVAASKFIFFRLAGGNMFNPELPVWLQFVWGTLESVVWVGLPVGIAAALIAWAVRPFRRFAFWFALTVSVIGAVYGMWNGMRVPAVRTLELPLEGLPEAFDGLRMVQLSDLHCSSAAREAKIRGIVRRANACDPDIVAITGDFVDGRPAQRLHDLEPLKELRARYGVFGCTGNHEKYWRISDWEPYFAGWNVRMLRNSAVEIRRGDSALALGGVDDQALGGLPSAVYADVSATAYRILLQHRPARCRDNALSLGVRLQLSGHTHGGVMPVVSWFVARSNEGHVSGLYREGGLTLYVSPGSGQWAGFPLRFFNAPEITLLVLRSR